MSLQSKSREKLLVLKEPVSKEFDSSVNVVGGSIASTTAGTLPVYNEDGELLGYIPIFDSQDLT